MLTLNHAITLRVIHPMRNTKESTEFLPETGGKLPATISHDGRRDSEPGDPMMKESLGTTLGSDGDQRNCLHPTGKPINDGQEIRMTVSRWKGTHEIQMEGGEAVIRHR